jgi:RNA polymerase sigma-70 factor (ECF subfamily)
MTQQSKHDQDEWIAVQRGDIHVFDTMFRSYYPMLCAYARRIVSHEDAEEVVQDVMLRLWEHRSELEIHTSLHAYLFRAVYTRALNRLAANEAGILTQQRFFEREKELKVFEETDPTLLHDLIKHLKEALQTLPPEQRITFIMHRFKEMTHKEIATALDVSPKTVDYRIREAVKKLRVELKDYLTLFLL